MQSATLHNDSSFDRPRRQPLLKELALGPSSHGSKIDLKPFLGCIAGFDIENFKRHHVFILTKLNPRKLLNRTMFPMSNSNTSLKYSQTQ